MSKTLKRSGIVVAVLFAAIAATQVVRPANANRLTDSSRSIQAQPGTSSALAGVLNRSCGDCHSNTMESRWYTRMPPFSALMARGAREGRKAINFSEWTGYSPEQQHAILLASCTDATLGTMPMKAYLRFRHDARLSNQDVETICSAARQVDEAPATSATGQARRAP
jgi:hypothetical protein